MLLILFTSLHFVFLYDRTMFHSHVFNPFSPLHTAHRYPLRKTQCMIEQQLVLRVCEPECVCMICMICDVIVIMYYCDICVCRAIYVCLNALMNVSICGLSYPRFMYMCEGHIVMIIKATLELSTISLLSPNYIFIQHDSYYIV